MMELFAAHPVQIFIGLVLLFAALATVQTNALRKESRSGKPSSRRRSGHRGSKH